MKIKSEVKNSHKWLQLIGVELKEGSVVSSLWTFNYFIQIHR